MQLLVWAGVCRTLSDPETRDPRSRAVDSQSGVISNPNSDGVRGAGDARIIVAYCVLAKRGKLLFRQI